MTNLSAFEYNGVTIQANGDELNLNNLWESAGKPKNKDPRRWVQTESSQSFIASVARKLNVAKSDILKSKRGKGGGTLAHWQVAIAYAKYLDDDLHIFCNDVFKRYLQGDASLAEEIIDRNNNPEDLKRIELRAKARRTNKQLNSAIAAHGGDCYRVVANINNVAVTGKTAREIRAIRKVKHTRDGLDSLELTMLAAAEELEASGYEARGVSGNDAIVNIVKEVGDDISRLMQKYTK